MYPTLVYDWCILQVSELSYTSSSSIHKTSLLLTKLGVSKIGINISSFKINWTVLLSTRTKIFIKLLQSKENMNVRDRGDGKNSEWL